MLPTITSYYSIWRVSYKYIRHKLLIPNVLKCNKYRSRTQTINIDLNINSNQKNCILYMSFFI